MSRDVLYVVVVPGEVSPVDSKSFGSTLAKTLVKSEGFDIAVVARNVDVDGRLVERSLIFGVWRKPGKIISSKSEPVIRAHAAAYDFGDAIAPVGAPGSGPRPARKTWNFTGYWSAVLGAGRSPQQVVDEFHLRPNDLHSLDEWLVRAEEQAWRSVGKGAEMPQSWWDFHQRALGQLSAVDQGAARRRA